MTSCPPATLKRLLHDQQELANPMETAALLRVAACPLESNMLEWHVNLTAPEEHPLAGAVFHAVMTFPPNYPSSPPTVTLQTPLPHENVSRSRGGGWELCCDMLGN